MSLNIECFSVREVTVKYKTIERYSEGRRFSNSRDIFEAFRNRMNAERVEVFSAILLDSKNRQMTLDTISRGSLSTSVVHPREVYTNAVRLQAAAIIFMHNHPSGDPAPSREDRECTERLVKAGTLLGIRVLDHIVFGFDDWYSFADAGYLNSIPTSCLPDMRQIILPEESIHHETF